MLKELVDRQHGVFRKLIFKNYNNKKQKHRPFLSLIQVRKFLFSLKFNAMQAAEAKKYKSFFQSRNTPVLGLGDEVCTLRIR